MRISRHRFVHAAAAPMLVAGRPQSPPASGLTAMQLVDRIRGAVGVLDAREAGAAKALIAVGRIVSEEPGMRACAAWIRTLAPGLRVEALPVADPFWNPAV